MAPGAPNTWNGPTLIQLNKAPSNRLTLTFERGITALNINTMQISKHKVAGIHYTLRDNEGMILDSSSGKSPLYYLHGVGNLIPGMENGLEGRLTGDKLSLTIDPSEGYGLRDPEMIQKVPVQAFGGQEVMPGMKFQTNTGDVVTVTEVAADYVTIDGNHPLAGVELHFEVEVVEVREASADEISHGHVHGPDGHH